MYIYNAYLYAYIIDTRLNYVNVYFIIRAFKFMMKKKFTNKYKYIYLYVIFLITILANFFLSFS